MKNRNFFWRGFLMVAIGVGCGTMCWAMIMIPFTGLRELTRRADVIAMVRIGSRMMYQHGKWEIDTFPGLSASDFLMTYAATPVQVFKGPPETTQTLQRIPLGLILRSIGERSIDLNGQPIALTPFDRRFIAYMNQTPDYLGGVQQPPTTGTLALVFFDHENFQITLKSQDRYPGRQVYSDYMPGAVVYLPPQLAHEPVGGGTDEEKVERLVEKAIRLGNPYATNTEKK